MTLSPVFKIGMLFTSFLLGLMVLHQFRTRRRHPIPRDAPVAGASALRGRVVAVGDELAGPVSGSSAAVWLALEEDGEDGTTTIRARDWADDLMLLLADGASIRLRVDGPPDISGAHVVRGDVRSDLAEQGHPFKEGKLIPSQRLIERSVRIGDEVYVTGWFVHDPADATEDPMRRVEQPQPATWRVAKDDAGAPPLIHVGTHRDFAFLRRAWREYYGGAAKIYLWMLGLFMLIEIVIATAE